MISLEHAKIAGLVLTLLINMCIAFLLGFREGEQYEKKRSSAAKDGVRMVFGQSITVNKEWAADLERRMRASRLEHM